MAYSIIKALGFAKGMEDGWHTVDPLPMTLGEISKTFRGLYLVLSHPALLNPILFDLVANLNLFKDYTITLDAWFTANPNTALPVAGSDVSIVRKNALYSNLFVSGYRITPVHPTYDLSVEVPFSEKTHLLLTKANVDYTAFQRNVLVNVNGLYHRCNATVDGIKIVDGNKSVLVSNMHQVGGLTFDQVSAFTCYPFTEDMIHLPDGDNFSLYSDCLIDTGVSLTGKSVALVIGGYMHIDNNAYQVIGDKTIRIDFRKIPVLERLDESRKRIDLSALKQYITYNNNVAYNVQAILSDNFVKAYLALSQSFLVVFDNAPVIAEKLPVHDSRVPGTYVYHKPLTGPLETRTCRVLNYLRSVEEGDRYCARTEPFKDAHGYQGTVPWYEEERVAIGNDPTTPTHVGKAYHNEIFIESVVITA